MPEVYSCVSFDSRPGPCTRDNLKHERPPMIIIAISITSLGLAWRNSNTSGQAASREQHGSSKKSKGPIITKYTPAPSPGSLVTRYGHPPGYGPPPAPYPGGTPSYPPQYPPYTPSTPTYAPGYSAPGYPHVYPPPSYGGPPPGLPAPPPGPPPPGTYGSHPPPPQPPGPPAAYARPYGPPPTRQDSMPYGSHPPYPSYPPPAPAPYGQHAPPFPPPYPPQSAPPPYAHPPVSRPSGPSPGPSPLPHPSRSSGSPPIPRQSPASTTLPLPPSLPPKPPQPGRGRRDFPDHPRDHRNRRRHDRHNRNHDNRQKKNQSQTRQQEQKVQEGQRRPEPKATHQLKPPSPPKQEEPKAQGPPAKQESITPARTPETKKVETEDPRPASPPKSDTTPDNGVEKDDDEWEEKAIFKEPEAPHAPDEVGKPLPTSYSDEVLLPRKWDAKCIESDYVKADNLEEYVKPIHETQYWPSVEFDPAFARDGKLPCGDPLPNVPPGGNEGPPSDSSESGEVHESRSKRGHSSDDSLTERPPKRQRSQSPFNMRRRGSRDDGRPSLWDSLEPRNHRARRDSSGHHAKSPDETPKRKPSGNGTAKPKRRQQRLDAAYSRRW
ncbi:hypothetical protein ACJZ2D_013808 [Fusarium nematophilum]